MIFFVEMTIILPVVVRLARHSRYSSFIGTQTKQLSKCDKFIGEASEKAEKAWSKAMQYFYECNKACMTLGIYLPGILILVWNNALNFQWGNKGALWWAGPYVVIQCHPTGSYILAELDRTVIRKPFTACHLKIYYHWDNKMPSIWIDWKYHDDEDLGILESDQDAQDNDKEQNEDAELKINKTSHSFIHKIKHIVNHPRLPWPWELWGKQSDDYWQKIFDDWRSGETAKWLIMRKPVQWQQDIDDWNAEDNQYWNYHDDYKGIDLEEILRYKNAPAQMPALFTWKESGQWLPPGMGITVIDNDPCGSSAQLG